MAGCLTLYRCAGPGHQSASVKVQVAVLVQSTSVRSEIFLLARSCAACHCWPLRTCLVNLPARLLSGLQGEAKAFLIGEIAEFVNVRITGADQLLIQSAIHKVPLTPHSSGSRLYPACRYQPVSLFVVGLLRSCELCACVHAVKGLGMTAL